MKYKFSVFILSLLILSAAANAQLREIVTIAGNGATGYGGDGFSAPGGTLSGPLGVAVDYLGNVYIEDFYNNRVRKVNTAGIITTYVGNGLTGNSGDGSIASNAELIPSGLAVDKLGNLYISDEDYEVIRKVNSIGIISTVVGNGAYGYAGDGGNAMSASFRNPGGIAIDNEGDLFIADVSNHVVRKVNSMGTITTIAGIAGTGGFGGNGGLATAATLDSPSAVAVDKKGNVYITDFGNNVIRKIDTAKKISTYAGSVARGYYGDGGAATLAQLNAPRGIAVDTFGNLYIADGNNNVIRMVDTAQNITTVVGDGTQGFSGDLGNALSANLFNPYAVAVDVYGTIYIADANNQRVRKAFFPSLAVHNVAPKVALVTYPNPFTTSVTVSALAKSDNVVVCDLAGRQVTQVWTIDHDGEQTFAIGELAPGMYMLQVLDVAGNKKSIVKLVKE
jgi:sugar lactone lactonase YvrE